MRYENHATVKVVDGISERIDRFHVQVIGRFIKQQQMRHLPSQPSKYNSTALTIGQLTNRTNLNMKNNGTLDCSFLNFTIS